MKLANLFGDRAVLQREVSVPVWGQTRPFTQVIVKVGPYVAQSQSGNDGRFIVRLPPMPAGGPFELEAWSPEHGDRTIARDVWIGEVWIASGQSNMEFTVAQLGHEECDWAKETATGIRMATVARVAHAGQQSDVEADWQIAGPQTTPLFSAVALHFAREIHRTLGVTVGIINSSWGGTIIEAWTSRQTLIRNDEVNSWIQRYEATTHSPGFWNDPQTANAVSPFPCDPGNGALARGWAAAEFDDAAWPTMQIPSTWTSQGLRHSGVFWFRRSVTVPTAWAGQDLILGLGAADKQDITYFNGEQVGATGTGFQEQYWNQQRTYRIPGHLVKAGRNVIASRVYSFAFDGGLIGPAIRMQLAPADSAQAPLPLAGPWRYQIEHNFGLVVVPTRICGPGNPNSPYILFDNMIAPLIPYAIRGAIWYQGESNSAEPQKYCRLMQELIRDWRHAWGQGDFPFYIVQLANFVTANCWPLLREAQFKAITEPNTGMAVTIDIGDPGNIHPANKLDVGRRLAQWALAQAYGLDVEPSGPLYAGMSVEDSRIRIRFTHTRGGLLAKGGPLATFIIAGEDRKFLPAEARIEGNSVIVWHPDIRVPCAVRYAWDNDPAGCNLRNGHDLPASPFRTDVWP